MKIILKRSPEFEVRSRKLKLVSEDEIRMNEQSFAELDYDKSEPEKES